MTVYLVISLPKKYLQIPYIHRIYIYMALSNPGYDELMWTCLLIQSCVGLARTIYVHIYIRYIYRVFLAGK